MVTRREGNGDSGRSRGGTSTSHRPEGVQPHRSGSRLGPYRTGAMPGPLELMRDPWEAMRRMRDEMDRVWGGTWGGERGMSAWMPRIEMFEREDQLVIRAELPGLGKDDVKVRVHRDHLHIEGERQSEQRHEEDRWYESEWSYGRFARQIPLPDTVDPEKIEAKFDRGVLEITMPMTESRLRSREVPIEGGGGERGPSSHK